MRSVVDTAPAEPADMKQQTLRILIGVALVAATLVLLHSLLTPILWAGLIAMSTWPLRQRAVGPRGLRLAPWFAAALLTGAVVGVFVVPFGYVVVRGWHEVPALLRLWTSSRESGLPAPDWLVGVPWGRGLAVADMERSPERPRRAQRLRPFAGRSSTSRAVAASPRWSRTTR